MASPVSTVTFSEHVFEANTLITNQFADRGITLSPAFYYDGLLPNGANPPCDSASQNIPNISGHCLTNFPTTNQTSGLFAPFSIFFNSDVLSSAFTLVVDAPYNLTVNALHNGVVVGTGVVSVSDIQANNFVNIVGSNPMVDGFNQITVINQTSSGAPTQVLLDNVQIGAAVPEPSSITLIGLGLSGVLVGIRRRRRA